MTQIEIVIKALELSDIPVLVDAFQKANWQKPASLFEAYYQEQLQSERVIWLAYSQGQIAGYVTLKWISQYKPFANQKIPEIMDLNVLPSFRKRGIGRALLTAAEEEASGQRDSVGIGVGLYGGADGGYGQAQRLYINRGYIPDGLGVTYDYKPTVPGEAYPLDDDLILWFTKKLNNHRLAEDNTPIKTKAISSKLADAVVLHQATREDYPVIQNMARFYVYDLSRECGFISDDWACPPDGLYESFDFKCYFEDPSRRAYLIKINHELAGFALLNQEGISPETDWNMGEFFILAKFQGKGIAQYVAQQLWTTHPGLWEVSVIPENQKALSFWRKTVSSFSHGHYLEKVCQVPYDDQQPNRHILSFQARLD